MAIIKCSECEGDVSSKAFACPKCGNPIANEPVTAMSLPRKGPAPGLTLIKVLGAVSVFAVVLIVSLFAQDPTKGKVEGIPPVADQASASEPLTCEPDDLRCVGGKMDAAAQVRCKDPIQHLAKFSARWTDGFLEPMFSRYRWTSQEGAGVTFIGDKIEFQNGFGAYTPMTYECDLSPDGKTVLDVRVRQGRLPA